MTPEEQFAFNKAKALALHDHDERNSAPVQAEGGRSLGMNLLDMALHPSARAAEALGVPEGPHASDIFAGYVEPGAQKKVTEAPAPRVMMSGEGPRESMSSDLQGQPTKGSYLDPSARDAATTAIDTFIPTGKILKGIAGAPRGLLGSLTNLTPKAAATLANSAKEVRQLVPLIESGNLAAIERPAEQAFNSTMRSLPAQGAENAEKIRELSAGRMVPTNIEHLKTLAGAGDEKAAELLKNATGGNINIAPSEATQIPLEELYRQRQAAGELAGFAKDPITGLPNARHAEMGAVQRQIKQMMQEIPDIGDKLKELSDKSYSGIRLQTKLKNIAPLNLVKSDAHVAKLQRLAEDQGLPDLLNMNRQYQAAKEISAQPGFWDAIRDINIKQPLKSLAATTAPVAQRLLPAAEKLKNMAEKLPNSSAWDSLKSKITGE